MVIGLGGEGMRREVGRARWGERSGGRSVVRRTWMERERSTYNEGVVVQSCEKRRPFSDEKNLDGERGGTCSRSGRCKVDQRWEEPARRVRFLLWGIEVGERGRGALYMRWGREVVVRSSPGRATNGLGS